MNGKLDVMWNVELALHRGPIDGVQLVSAEASCWGINKDGTDAPPSLDFMEQNAIQYVSELLGEDPAAFEIISLTWSSMPFVEVDEATPPPAP